ncbi:hypothetical protein EYF80_017049 [Liparis tanakae]|uniref:Uncharacterized protein n=1 Tax=Liparis tanakae TaxID=230148 RepID=A0A4Z2I5N1_9TELE|nr:hypothetical protein EYF80_017049 [Liparis tanakae]
MGEEAEEPSLTWGMGPDGTKPHLLLLHVENGRRARGGGEGDGSVQPAGRGSWRLMFRVNTDRSSDSVPSRRKVFDQRSRGEQSAMLDVYLQDHGHEDGSKFRVAPLRVISQKADEYVNAAACPCPRGRTRPVRWRLSRDGGGSQVESPLRNV